MQSTLGISLLKFHLLRRFDSGLGACKTPHKDRTFACQMIVIDILAANIECWMVFLTHLLIKIEDHGYRLDLRSRMHNVSALQSFTTLIRDLDVAVEFTLGAVKLRSKDYEKTTEASLGAIAFELRAKTQTLKMKVEDLKSHVESAADVKELISQENQTLAVNRLTLLAAIFVRMIFVHYSLLRSQIRTVVFFQRYPSL